MNSSVKRLAGLAVLALVSLVSLLTVGAAVASARDGGRGVGRVSADALVAEAAEQLAVPTATLETAIVNAAITAIDEAVADEEVDADDADELRETARDSLRFAVAVSRTRTVAANLGLTTTRLNAAFRAARGTLLLERIDAAVAAGRLDADDAAELRAEVADAELPGYKTLGRGFDSGFGRGHGRFGR